VHWGVGNAAREGYGTGISAILHLAVPICAPTHWVRFFLPLHQYSPVPFPNSQDRRGELRDSATQRTRRQKIRAGPGPGQPSAALAPTEPWPGDP